MDTEPSGRESAMSSSVAKRALDKVFERYDRRVINSIERANYVECLIATLLGGLVNDN